MLKQRCMQVITRRLGRAGYSAILLLTGFQPCFCPKTSCATYAILLAPCSSRSFRNPFLCNFAHTLMKWHAKRTTFVGSLGQILWKQYRFLVFQTVQITATDPMIIASLSLPVLSFKPVSIQICQAYKKVSIPQDTLTTLQTYFANGNKKNKCS
jgi:hypothetical protein